MLFGINAGTQSIDEILLLPFAQIATGGLECM
jgi:hypothetical protein